jgi:hypothetical protein
VLTTLSKRPSRDPYPHARHHLPETESCPCAAPSRMRRIGPPAPTIDHHPLRDVFPSQFEAALHANEGTEAALSDILTAKRVWM